MLHTVVQALQDQALSTALRESTWIYPVIESVHVLTIVVFVGFAVLLDLRLLGVWLTSKPVSHVAEAFLPRTIGAFAVMVATGLTLFYAKPLDTAFNPFFQAKLVVIGIAALNIYYYHRIVSTDIAAWDNQPVPPARVRVSGLVSLLSWVTVVVCGRLIAYNWFN